MSDLLFRCPKCNSSFSIEDALAGQEFKCTSCGATTTVPSSDIKTKCHHCQAELATGAAYAEQTFDCPECDGPVVMPKLSKSTLAVKRPEAPTQAQTVPVGFSNVSFQPPPRKRVRANFDLAGWLIPLILAIIGFGFYIYLKPTPPDPDPTRAADYRVLKCGFMTLYSMDILAKGNTNGAFSGLDYTRRTITGTEFDSFFNKTNYTVKCENCSGKGSTKLVCDTCKGEGKCVLCKGTSKCPGCSGTGKVGLSCPTCNSTGKCVECDGVGKVTRTMQTSKRVPIEKLKSSGNVKSMGEMTRLVKTSERIQVDCANCRGSGKCTKCDNGKKQDICRTCSGTGACKCKDGGKCLTCNGAGGSTLKCETCAGTGLLYSADRFQQNRIETLAKLQALITTRQSLEKESSFMLKGVIEYFRTADPSNAIMAIDPNESIFFTVFTTTNSLSGKL